MMQKLRRVISDESKHVKVEENSQGKNKTKQLSMHYNKGQLKSYNDFVTWTEETCESLCTAATAAADEIEPPEIDTRLLVKLKSKDERKKQIEIMLKDILKLKGVSEYIKEMLERLEKLDKDGVAESLFAEGSGSRGSHINNHDQDDD